MPSLEEEILALPPEEAAWRIENIRLVGEPKKADRLVAAYLRAKQVDLNAVAGRAPRSGSNSAPVAPISPQIDVAVSNGSSVFGLVLMLVGCALMLAGFVLPATVDAQAVSSSLGLGSAGAPSFEVNNIGRLNTKMMLVVAGAALWVGGCIFRTRS